MLSLRLGTGTAPIDLTCSLCPSTLPADETFFLIETDPLHEKIYTEYETVCRACHDAVKAAAIKHKVPIEWDIEPPKGTHLSVGDTLKTG